MKKLIIVESPSKAKTISSFINKKEYEVTASYGHLRDLPKHSLGIDIENNFKPKYSIARTNNKKVKELKEKAKNKEVILATDEDREGEAIAWHLIHILKLEPNTPRIVFHEITEKAIKEALQTPREINMDLVNAQQARRILDRLVGYKLSPFLWKKLLKGLSAGRVQTPALKLIYQRELEIKNFKQEEYFSIEGLFEKDCSGNLTKIDNKTFDKFKIQEKELTKIKEDLKNKQVKITKIETKEQKKNPLPPFTTSTLQQASFSVLGFSSKKTMSIAQKLYEGKEINKKRIGLITYMRTDSLNIASQAISEARKLIQTNFSNDLPDKPNFYKTKSKVAQEAHEAIRPTNPSLTPQSIETSLTRDEFKLYDLIWKRFIACQMKPAILSKQSIVFDSQNTKTIYTFQNTYQKILKQGFLKVLPLQTKNEEHKNITESDLLNINEIKTEQHFTEPPARYNDASLIKALEKYGIGRPSTYSNILSVLTDRGYVEYRSNSKGMFLTNIGEKTAKLLTENFTIISDYDLTQRMEDNLDKIANGDQEYTKIIEKFYTPFIQNLKEKEETVEKIKLIENDKTDKICPNCGANLIIKMSRYGKFLACPNFPKCKHIENIIDEKNAIDCPKCKKGKIIKRKTKKGKVFYGCTNYPNCDFIINKKPTKEKCPECKYPLLKLKTKYKCSNKECKYERNIKTDK